MLTDMAKSFYHSVVELEHVVIGNSSRQQAVYYLARAGPEVLPMGNIFNGTVSMAYPTTRILRGLSAHRPRILFIFAISTSNYCVDLK